MLLASLCSANIRPNDFKPPALTEYRLNLIQRAKLGTIEERVKAIDECGVSRPALCYYTLIDLISDESPIIRERAALALGSLRDKSAITYIDKALTIESNQTVKISLLRALILLRHKDAATIALKYIEDPDEKIRFTAAKVLVANGDESFYAKIQSSISAEKSDLVKVMLIHAALKIKKGSNSGKNGENYSTELIRYFFSTNRDIRLYSARAAMDLKLKETLAPLHEAILKEGDPVVRDAFYKAFVQSYNK